METMPSAWEMAEKIIDPNTKFKWLSSGVWSRYFSSDPIVSVTQRPKRPRMVLPHVIIQ